jgi:type IV secretory pathway TraG/TraD family ATPase VirD4
MGIYFGGLPLPDEAATSHFMIVGTTGSGKTLTLRMMMGSVLPEIARVSDHRAVIFDVKQDMVSILYGMGFSYQKVCILNPFDSRCHEWDMAADIPGPDIALQVAAILIPEENSQNRYFSDAARDLLGGVMNVFIEKAKERQKKDSSLKPSWRLADLIYATRSPERLKHVLNQTEEGKDLVVLHLEGGSNTTRSIISTVRTRLHPFEVIAAMWSQAGQQGRRVSLKAFLKENKILVLGNNQEAITPIQAINRVIFQRLTELSLNQEESSTRRTWFFLDEVRKLGKLEGLGDLMTNGRSKGACVVLGFQDIDGLRDVYGKEVAGELTSMCGSFGVLKVSGASTPQWASEIFGEQEILQTVRNSSSSSNFQGASFSSGETEQIRERKLYLPSQFRMVPLPREGEPLYGFFCSSILGSRPYRAEIPSSEVSEMLHRKAPSQNNFVPWENEECKKLPVWGVQDYLRLNIDPFISAPGSSAAIDDSHSQDVEPEIDEFLIPVASKGSSRGPQSNISNEH